MKSSQKVETIKADMHSQACYLYQNIQFWSLLTACRLSGNGQRANPHVAAVWGGAWNTVADEVLTELPAYFMTK